VAIVELETATSSWILRFGRAGGIAGMSKMARRRD
jgi:hypothetical protein